MEWSTLSILNAAVVQKEVDTAISLLKRYSEDGNTKLGSLIDSIKKRVDELEVFYGSNDDDNRAVLFEKERAKLRKALQLYIGPISPSQMSPRSVFQATTNSNNKLQSVSKKMELSDLEGMKKEKNTSAQSSPLRNSMIGDDVLFISPRAVAQSKSKVVEPDPMTRKIKSSMPLYAWEGGRISRGKIQVDTDSYVPTSVAGVYIREEGEMEFAPLNDKWMDVKVVLTQEELVTLIKRKKALKRAKNLGLSSANFISVQSSTPYIDPSRIRKETYRPDQPSKWITSVYHNK